MSRFLGLPQNATGNLDLSSYTIIKSSCSGTLGASTLSATNTSFVAGQRIFICQMRGTGVGERYEDNIIDSYVDGTITLKYNLENTYTDSEASQAQVVVVPTASTSSGTLTIPDWDGDVGGLFVMAVTTAGGTIVGTGKGYAGGDGRRKSDGTIGIQGESTTGVGTNSNSANTGAGGGGGILNIASGNGGGGSYGTSGNPGTGSGLQAGLSGSTYGSADLSSGLFMGSGGGGGYQDGTGGDGGNGGDGGGIIRVYAHTLLASFTINNNGDQGATNTYNGGSGSGGTNSIKCVVNLGATLTATGGATVTGTGGNTGNGGAGGDGRIRIESCSNTAGTEDPSASTSIGGHNYCGILGGMI